MATPVKWSADLVVNSFGPLGQFEPDVVVMKDGRYGISISGQYSTDYDASFKTYSASGLDVACILSVEGSSTINSRQMEVAALSDGRLVGIYTREPVASGGDLRDLWFGSWTGAGLNTSATVNTMVTPVVVGAGSGPDLPVGQFIFSTTQHKLFWDADGTGAGVAVQLCTLKGINTLSVNDFIIVA